MALYGRCGRCRDVRELFRNGREYHCENCCGRSHENHGRPTLPHDAGDARVVYQVDWVYSQK